MQLLLVYEAFCKQDQFWRLVIICLEVVDEDSPADRQHVAVFVTAKMPATFKVCRQQRDEFQVTQVFLVEADLLDLHGLLEIFESHFVNQITMALE